MFEFIYIIFIITIYGAIYRGIHESLMKFLKFIDKDRKFINSDAVSVLDTFPVGVNIRTFHMCLIVIPIIGVVTLVILIMYLLFELPFKYFKKCKNKTQRIKLN